MNKGLALVVGIDAYRTFDASGGHDLAHARAEGKRAVESLEAEGLEVLSLLDGEVTGSGLRETFLGMCRRAVEDELPLMFFFAGCGATRADGAYVLCTADTDRSLRGAVPLDDLAWIASTAGPGRISIVLRCGFAGLEKDGARTRTLTPNARPDPERRLFRRSDVVVAWPTDAMVEDRLPPCEETPFGTIHLYQISGTAGGGLYDIEVPGVPGIDGTLVIGASDNAPSGFTGAHEYWRFVASPWPARFALTHSKVVGSTEPSDYQKYKHAAFPSASAVVVNPPAGTFFRVLRNPGNTLVGYLRNHDAGGPVSKQTWYAVPGQLDSDKFFLFGTSDTLDFDKLGSPPNIGGTTMHVVVADRVS